MIVTTVLSFVKRLPFRWYELMVGGVLVVGIGIVWYQSQRIESLDQQAYVDQEAIDAAIRINDNLAQRQVIDQSIVLDWMRAREAYREQTRKIIDTTFLDYFNLPIKVPTDAVVSAPVSRPSLSTTPSTVVETSDSSMSDDQLDVLTNGMWDVYCQTGTTNPDCLP